MDPLNGTDGCSNGANGDESEWIIWNSNGDNDSNGDNSTNGDNGTNGENGTNNGTNGDNATNDKKGNWTAVKPAVDLETTPLEIKTNSTLGCRDEVYVYFYNSQGEYAGAVWISFTSTPQYGLGWCSSFTNFTSNLPAAVDKVWRISLTRTSGIRLQIHCNDVEVVNTLLSDDTCYSYWREYWSRDVEKIAFPEYDTASDYYRLYQQGEGNWTAVRPAVDLETTLLEIKTNSTLESGDRVDVWFYNSQGEDAGGVRIYFSSTSQYYLYRCSLWTNFTSNLPAAVEKVWRISLNKTSGIRLQIHCNDVEVVNTLLSDDTCGDSYWREYWSRDVEKIAFSRDDTASVYYRRFKPGCTGLKAAWTGTMATTTKFPVDPGTVVEVTCSDTGTFNNGSSQVTCASATQFTYQIEPLCIDLAYRTRRLYSNRGQGEVYPAQRIGQNVFFNQWRYQLEDQQKYNQRIGHDDF
ncbi:hypothetical protein ACHWQZ_G005132 [Mnemiopsis leidyi]